MNIQGIPSMTHGPASTRSNAAGSASANDSAATTNAPSAENAFIQLLVIELKSQDPTSPMDPNTMVGQMFQMNQLQQLIDINQKLGAIGASPSSHSSAVIPSNLDSSILQGGTVSSRSVATSDSQHLLKGAR